MFTNVMWATDGSQLANRAFGYAARIAKDDSATLHAVHVIERLTAARLAGELARADEAELDQRIRRQVADHDQAEGTQTIVHMIPGDTGQIAKQIAAVAENNDVDLIVIGSHGHSAMIGAVLGSVAAQLPHHASCPVLTVSAKAAARSRGALVSAASQARR